MAGALGIEPSSKVLETSILPIYDAPSLLAYCTICTTQNQGVFSYIFCFFNINR